MTPLNLSGLSPDGLMLLVMLGTDVLVLLALATIPGLWRGPATWEEPARYDPAQPGLFLVDEIELPAYSVIHETCPNPRCDERVCYCPATDGLPCVGTVDPDHTHQHVTRGRA